MKIVIFFIVATLVLISGCISNIEFEANKPADLYSCSTEDDCAVTFRNITTNTACSSEVINKKYIEWYNEKALEIVKYEGTCPLSTKPRLACEDSQCKRI
ncbi:hypothetical protein IIC68_01610 [archaeon]|nr:hypothetical protein [archaeon]